MSNPIRPFRLAAAVASLVLAACGGTDNQPDDYAGTLYGAALDAKLVPTSGTYPTQQGYANGKKVSFYNLGTIRTTSMPNPIPVSVARHQTNGSGGSSVDNFPNSCIPGPAFDARLDAFGRDKQAPIFDSLPLALTSTTLIVWPVVAQYGVTGVSGMTCNDLKDSRSIAGATDPEPGRYGARRTAIPNGYQLWPVIDLTATIASLGVTGDTTTRECPWDTNADPAKRARCGWLGWYKGLQISFLNGGRIPTQMVQDPAFPSDATKQIEALVPMEGVILDPAGSSAFAKTTDALAVLLPALPGEDAWSPIVRLHDFRLPSGKKLGDYTGVCGNGRPCAANLVDINAAGAAFNTIFVVAPQQ